MKSWKEPLDPTDFTDKNGVAHWLCDPNWFPSNAGLVVTKHGSIDKDVIIKVVEHINQHVRKTFPQHEHFFAFS